MKFTLNGKPAEMWFTFDNMYAKVPTRRGVEKIIKRTTTCNLVRDTGSPAISQTVTCFNKDNYSKSAGRIAALEKLCEQFDRPTRTQIWQAYWKATRRKPETEEQQLLRRVFKLIKDQYETETNAMLFTYPKPIDFDWQLGSDIHDYLAKKKLT